MARGYSKFAWVLLFPLLTGVAFAGEVSVQARVVAKIQEKYPSARIELTTPIQWSGERAPTHPQSISVTQESNGQVQLLAKSDDETVEGRVSFAAWVSAQIAAKRIQPGERLNAVLFSTQDLNIAVGQNHEYRGVILGSDTDVAMLETRQTVLEGQFLTTTAVQRIPDIRRGDAVRVHLISGGLTLSTLGTAEEPAYAEGRVKIMTLKTKRELVGTLTQGGVVEVDL